MGISDQAIGFVILGVGLVVVLLDVQPHVGDTLGEVSVECEGTGSRCALHGVDDIAAVGGEEMANGERHRHRRPLRVAVDLIGGLIEHGRHRPAGGRGTTDVADGMGVVITRCAERSGMHTFGTACPTGSDPDRTMPEPRPIEVVPACADRRGIVHAYVQVDAARGRGREPR